MRLSTAAVHVVLLLTAVAFAPKARSCCICRPSTPPEPREALLDADAVFSGMVVAIRSSSEGSNEAIASDLFEVDIDVLARWKGVSASHVTVATYDGSGCGISFSVGTSYLVYASSHQGRYWTSGCGRTTQLDRAGDDLAQLGTPIPAVISDDATRALIAQLRSDNVARRIEACNALALLPEAAAESVPALATLLEATHVPSERRSAADALGSLGVAASGAVPALLKLLEATHDPSEARSATAALGSLGAAASGTVPALAKLLADPDPAMGIEAARALDRLGPAAAPAVPQLVASLHDDEAIEALEARREHLPDGKEDELRDIERRLHDFESRRDMVIGVFGAIGPPAGRAAIDATLEQIRNGGFKPNFASALRQMGAGPEVAMMFAADLTAKPDDSERSLLGLGELGPDAAPAIPVLVKMLWNPDWWTRSTAAGVLGAIGPSAAEAVPSLVDALDKEDIDEGAVVGALASIGSPAAAPVLARAARGSSDPRVPPLARRALVAMGLDPDTVEPAPGKPHGKEPAPPPVTQTPEQAMEIGAAPQLPYLTSFPRFGGFSCGSLATHPAGLVGADCPGGGVALMDVETGAEAIARLASPDGPAADGESTSFGSEVAVLGTTILVSAPRFSGAAIKCGAVYAFPTGGGNPRRIDNPFPAYNAGFGGTLAAGPDFFVSSVAPSDELPNGALLVLDAAGTLMRKIDEPPEGVSFRGQLAVVGGRIAYAEMREILIFDPKLGTLLRTIHGPEPADDDDFGRMIAPLGDDHLLVSAKERMHVVDLTNGAVTATVLDPEPSGEADRFPTSFAAIDATRFAVGGGWLVARRHVYVFDLSGRLVSVARLPDNTDRPRLESFRDAVGVAKGRLIADSDDGFLIYGVDRREGGAQVIAPTP